MKVYIVAIDEGGEYPKKSYEVFDSAEKAKSYFEEKKAPIAKIADNGDSFNVDADTEDHYVAFDCGGWLSYHFEIEIVEKEIC